MGNRLLARALEEPQRQIVENAGEEAAVVLNAVKAGTGAYGDRGRASTRWSSRRCHG